MKATNSSLLIEQACVSRTQNSAICTLSKQPKLKEILFQVIQTYSEIYMVQIELKTYKEDACIIVYLWIREGFRRKKTYFLWSFGGVSKGSEKTILLF